MSADPIPVPKVSSMTTPETSLPAPKRSSARARGVGVVERGDLTATEVLAEQVVDVCPDPGLVDVGGGAHHTVGIHTRQRHPDRALPVEMRHHLGDRLGDRVRRRRLRGEDLEAFPHELTGVEIDDAALGARTADVHAETEIAAGLRTGAGHRVGGGWGGGLGHSRPFHGAASPETVVAVRRTDRSCLTRLGHRGDIGAADSGLGRGRFGRLDRVCTARCVPAHCVRCGDVLTW